jgi:hypothetical protein
MYKSAALANIAIVETVIKEFSNVPIKHRRAFIAWMMFKKRIGILCVAVFIVGVLRAARSWRRRPAGLGFAIRDCACKPYTQWRYPAAAIVAAAIIDVIRLRTANSVS